MATSRCHFLIVEQEVGPARRTTGARTGGRSERVVAAVLHAALAELARVGYGALRLEDVATVAGVAKTTIYRRWPTKAELIRAAIYQFGRYDEPYPDTGSLRSDILAILESAVAMCNTPEGSALARMVTTEAGDPEVDELIRTLREESRERRSEVVRRAQKRGEIPADVDPSLIMEAVFAVVMARVVRFREKVDRASWERLVDLVVTGAEHGGGTMRPRASARRGR
jgi:AcrR family transcriptional regulator